MTILLNAVTKAATDAAAVNSQVIRMSSPPAGGSQYSKMTFQGILRNSTAAASSTTILVQVSNDPVAFSAPDLAAWLTIGTISLSGTPTATGNLTDGFAVDADWKCVRGRIAQNATTGTGAVVSLVLGA